MTQCINNQARAELTNFIEEIRKLKIWYAKSAQRYFLMYYALQFTTMLCGGLAAALAAFAKEITGEWVRPFLIALPLLGSFAAGFLSKFRVYDIRRIRADGVLAFQDLHWKAQQLLGTVESEGDCSKIHDELRVLATKIERDQAEKLFAVRRGTDSVTLKRKS